MNSELKEDIYFIHNYGTGEVIGWVELPDHKFAEYLAKSQQPQGILRLCDLADLAVYELEEEHRDTGLDTVVYLERLP